jgi:uncharacterized protein
LQPSVTRLVVTDAGPLIALGRLDLLSLLPRLFEEVQIPEAVLAECLARPELPDATRVQAAVRHEWLRVCQGEPVARHGLGAGESQAIGRAIEIGAALLSDDRAARQHAMELGLVVTGTLAVLVSAKRKGMVPQVRQLIEQLRASGYWLSDTVVTAALNAAGEPVL